MPRLLKRDPQRRTSGAVHRGMIRQGTAGYHGVARFVVALEAGFGRAAASAVPPDGCGRILS